MTADVQVLEQEADRESTVEPAAPQMKSPSPKAILTVAYASTIFLSAFLLFQVQLIMGKYILPFFGGAPSVWTVCLLFFQILLLLGYGYAHFISGRSHLKLQGKAHASVLLACLAVFAALWTRWGTPLTPGAAWMSMPGGSPIWRIFVLLGATVGLPFFVLSTTGPLLQSWHARSHVGHASYRLYALSNAGSLLGVLSYPFLVEWALTTRQQAAWWSMCFALFVLLTTAIALRLPEVSRVPASRTLETPEGEGAPKTRNYMLWLGLSACSSMMLLATTNLLCQDIATIPLLWVLPLALYLVSFILTFASDRWYPRALFWPLYSLVLGLGLKAVFQTQSASALREIGVFSAVLLVVCMICHGELAGSKPVARHLTGFYLMIAAGGAAGSAFAALIAPRVFRGFWEFPIALAGCGFLLFAAGVLDGQITKLNVGVWAVSLAILTTYLVPHFAVLIPWTESSLFLTRESHLGLAALAGLGVFFLLARRGKTSGVVRQARHFPWQPTAVLCLFGLFAVVAYAHTLLGGGIVLLQERNFFGVKYVVDALTSVQFQSGNIVHGGELTDTKRRSVPTFYYQKTSGAGLLLDNYPREESRLGGGLRVGLVGLGVGTLASYGRSQDQFRFYEIDPAVIRLSQGRDAYFHFLQDSRAAVTIVPGDARVSLQGEAAAGEFQDFDVLALDAFSGDAIPVHLLTREAVGLYLRHLHGPNSVLAFHITNRYLDLRPVVRALCDIYQLQAVEVQDGMARWILASRNPAMLRLPHLVEHAKAVTLTRNPVLWTDDYSNLFLVLQKPALLAKSVN